MNRLLTARSRWALPLLPLVFSFVGLLEAQEDPRRIVAEAQRRTESKSQQYEGTLQVLDGSNRVADKRWTFERMGSHGNSKAVLRFVAPAEVKGVALLIVNHPERSSDQWMWTPALQRERRIALQDRSTRFFGTDFSFEDIEERDVYQYDYRLVGNDTIDGVVCWRLESKPRRGKVSQYTKADIWVRQDTYAVVRIDSWIKNDVARRLVYGDFEQVQGIW
ncbi:MAG: outer membrane lipoprotein-sorting protein, partial [Vicinamibacterales bacterium]